MSKKIKINLEIIKALKPCQTRLDEYLKTFADFEGDLVDFLSLKGLQAQDKIWVALRVAPREILEIFAIDCAFAAEKYAYATTAAADAAYAAADAAAYATYGGANAAYAAAYAAADAAAYATYGGANAARLQERENQIDALIHLCKGM